MRRRQAADAAAHYDQIVGFAGIDGFAGRVPEGAVTHAVRCFERAGMAAAHSGERRRIVAWGFFGVGSLLAQKMPRHHGSARRDCHAVEEVATCDLAIHPQVAIPRIVHTTLPQVTTAKSRLALHFFYCQFRSLESDLAVGSIAEGLVYRSSAAA